MELLLIGLISLIISLISGMLGLGGAVLLIPAYLYLPPLFGMEPLDVKSISGLTTLQVLTTALFGTVMHRKHGKVDKNLVMYIGIPITGSALTGALISGIIKPEAILAIFATMAIAGTVLMVMKKNDGEAEYGSGEFNKAYAVLIAAVVGFFGGMVGAPGAFILAPLMLVVLKIPLRVTIGSTLGIVVMSAFAGSIGKIYTEQVPLYETLIASAAAIPGVYIGSILSHKIQASVLRVILAIVIGAAGIEMWFEILF